MFHKGRLVESAKSDGDSPIGRVATTGRPYLRLSVKAAGRDFND